MKKTNVHNLVYAAGGLFTQDELTTNVLLKKAVWEISNGTFELVLPQSMGQKDFDRPDIDAYIRNADLLQVVKSDAILARFDGLELDAGTVAEFMMAKFLGKPTVILRSDSRRMSGDSMDEPYNLMVKNWPRTVEVRVDSLTQFSQDFQQRQEKFGENETVEAMIEVEHSTVVYGINQLSQKIVEAFEKAIDMESPYTPEYQEVVYEIARLSPGSGFEQMLTEDKLTEIIQNLKEKGTL